MSFTLLGILQSQAAGGAATSYDLLQTTILSSNTRTLTFSGLGAYTDYQHLQVRIVAQMGTANPGFIYHRFNGDSSNVYSSHYLGEIGNQSVSTGNDGVNSSIGILGRASGDSDPNIFGVAIFDVLDFSNTNKNTTTRTISGDIQSTSNPLPNVTLRSTLYNKTDAVTSITFDGGSLDFAADSRFSLYGIKGTA